MARYDDINTPLVAMVGLVSVLAFVGIIVGLQGLYLSFERAEIERKVIAVEPIDAKNLLAEQEATLNRTGWLDRDKGIIAIPIERAMELVVKELQETNKEPDDA
jgi:hypothetical protein